MTTRRDSPLVYLDNAATSWPKPPAVAEMMMRYLTDIGANPGRAGHRLAVAAGRLVLQTRERLAELFGVDDPFRVVFTQNVTEALNLALLGLLRPGDHVVTTSMEHNAMMRPLHHLAQNGVELTVVPCRVDGALDPDEVARAVRPHTVLLAALHASNVVGTLLPVAELSRLTRERDILFLLDAAASAGQEPLDLERDGVDLLVFTGHKGLLGPTGTGGLVLGRRVPPGRLRPLIRGGTGSRSASHEQPDFLPDLYESGTLNVAGLAGLGASVGWLLEQGLDALRRRRWALVQSLLDGLQAIDGVTVYGTGDARRQTAAVSFNIAGLSPSTAGLRLDEEYGVLCRVGLHCAPAAHRTIGAFPDGTIRFAPGPFTTEAEIDRALQAVAALTTTRAR